MFFTFPEDARWNPERQAVEFGVEIAEYHGARRAEAPPGAVDRGWECRDQRPGLALGARSGHWRHGHSISVWENLSGLGHSSSPVGG
jgi:hypothetical protein